MSFDQDLIKAKLRQKKGEVVEAMEEAGVPVGKQEPTEYAKSARLIVEKMHDPQDMHEQQLHSNIPKSILPNVMMLQGIENAMRELVNFDSMIYDPLTQKVTLYRDVLTGFKDSKPVVEQQKFRTMTLKGFNQTNYWSNFWHGFTGNLMEELAAVEGGRARDAVAEVSAITNSDRALLEAQNNAGAGLLSRAWHGVFGRGKK